MSSNDKRLPKLKENHLIRYDFIIEKYEETLFDIVIGIHLAEYRRGARTYGQVVRPCSNGYFHSHPPIVKSIGISWQSRIIIVTSPKIRKITRRIGN